MRWDGIVYDGSDSCVLKFLLEKIPLRMTNDKEMPDRVSPFWHEGKDKIPGNMGNLVQIHRGDLLPATVPFIKSSEFNTKESSLQFIESGIVSNDLVVIPLY